MPSVTAWEKRSLPGGRLAPAARRAHRGASARPGRPAIRRAGPEVAAALLVALAASACRRAPEPRGEGAASAAATAENEPVAVRLNGREVRVRCELACAPLDAELGRLARACRADPLRAPHLVGVSGESLAGLGCCTEAEAAYRAACGLEGTLSRCGTEWAARCAREGS